jgi:hypothetical protein
MQLVTFVFIIPWSAFQGTIKTRAKSCITLVVLLTE